MQLAILGTGNVGAPVGRLWAAAGHSVFFGSRSPEKHAALIESAGPNVSVKRPEEAIRSADVVLEALPFHAVATLPTHALRGKILISASNYFPVRDGNIDLQGLSQTSWVARQHPGSRVVKAFSMIGGNVLNRYANGAAEEGLVMFISADDQEAKAVVEPLVRDTKLVPLDVGDLEDSRIYQSLEGPLFDARLRIDEAKAEVAKLLKKDR